MADENFEENLNLSSAEKIFLKSRMGINLMGTNKTMSKTWKENLKEKILILIENNSSKLYAKT